MFKSSLKVLSNIIFKPATIIAPAQYTKLFYHRKLRKYYQYPQDSYIRKQNIEIHSRYNYVLKATWYTHQSSTNKLIFLVPGYATIQLEADYIAPFFLNLGYDVVTFNTYVYGDTNALVTFGKRESEDFALLYEQLVTQSSYTHIGLYGHSMGANTVLHAGSIVTPTPDFIIANAPFNRLDETIASHLSLWTSKLSFKKDELSVARQIIKQAEHSWGNALLPKEAMTSVAKLSMPVLYLHGTHDEMNPFYMSEELLQVTATAQKVPLQNAGHLDTFIKTKTEIETAIIDFLHYIEGVFPRVSSK